MPSIAKIADLFRKANNAYAAREKIVKLANRLLLVMLVLTLATTVVYTKYQAVGIALAIINAVLAVVVAALAALTHTRKWKADDAQDEANAQAKELFGKAEQPKAPKEPF